jgi:hypothetical protein
MKDEAQYAPDVVRALKDSQAPIPPDLIALAEGLHLALLLCFID